MNLSQAPGGYTLTSQERVYAHFQIASFMDEEVSARNVYTKDEPRAYCACAVFFAKTPKIQSWECYNHMSPCNLRFNCM